MRSELERYAEDLLGPCRTTKDCSWNHGGSRVIRVRDAEGSSWYVKQHPHQELHTREVAAYQRWVPALGNRAPWLRAYDDERRLLVLSEVPGDTFVSVDTGVDPGVDAGHRTDVDVYHQAGTLLRRLHDAEALPPYGDYAARKQATLESWAARADGLLDRRELDFARSELRSLDGIPEPSLVPCHLDYSPRNWLVASGRVQVIDFEWAGPEVWVSDLARLYFGPWRQRPDLRDAFLAGYGRDLDGDAHGILLAGHALTAVWHVIWGHTHGNASFAASTRQTLQALMRREFSWF
ncbi:hypothetical protein [Actinopolymorpha alba]|uniref:hypothetical protein n=1 Tax=Actinopolymorpha alba TaxID=533267 RepID=UPI00037E7A83|nr:hypothetical protein [Actinopolymorpha alba]